MKYVKIIPHTTPKNEGIDNEFIENFHHFSQKIIKELLIENKNYIFSPLSLYYALTMLSEGTVGKSHEELNSLLITNNSLIRESLQKIYLNNYYSNEYGTVKLANSMWIREGYNINKSFSNVLKEYYFSDVFTTLFDNEGKKEIVKWINDQTLNLLNIKVESLPYSDKTVAAIINTVYFDNKWKHDFLKEDIYKDLFDNKTIVEYLNHSIDTYYINNEKYEAIFDFYENENKIKFIKPKDGYTVEELLEENIFDNSDIKKVKCYISIPKFEVSSNYDLIEPLKKLGVNGVFTNQVSNVIDGFDCKVNNIMQVAKIIVNEKGTKVAAMTNVEIALTCLLQETLEFKLDKPFIYIIYDRNNIPLFVGKIKSL